MKALLNKELRTLKPQLPVLIGLTVLFLALNKIMASNATVSAAIVMMAVMVPMSTMAYDEKVNWTRYAITLPITRTQIVLSKFLFGLILLVLMLGTVCVVSAIGTGFTVKLLKVTAVVGGLAVLYLALTMPILIKYGAEKSRYVAMGLLFVPMFGIPLVMRIFKPEDLDRIMTVIGNYAPIVGPLIVIAALAASYFLSVRLFEKKEF